MPDRTSGRGMIKRTMAQHLIWTAGIVGHLLLIAVLVIRGRAKRFPFFTLLILFDVLRSLALALVLRHLRPPALHAAIAAFEISDLFLEFAVLAELVVFALRPLGSIRRILLPLLILASGVLIVTRLAPISHYNVHTAPVLLHFLLGVLLLLWSIVLALLLRPLGLRWRSDVAAITFGFGVYSAVLLFAGGYFRIGRDLSDYILFSYLRIGVYLAVVFWWIASLWTAGRLSSTQRG